MLKIDGRNYIRKAIYKFYFYCVPLKSKKQNLGTVRIEADVERLEKMKTNIYQGNLVPKAKRYAGIEVDTKAI